MKADMLFLAQLISTKILPPRIFFDVGGGVGGTVVASASTR